MWVFLTGGDFLNVFNIVNELLYGFILPMCDAAK